MNSPLAQSKKVLFNYLPGVWCYLVCLTLGASYINKCYCPGVDPLINSDKALRNKMYLLKTNYTDTLNITYTRGELAGPGNPKSDRKYSS